MYHDYGVAFDFFLKVLYDIFATFSEKFFRHVPSRLVGRKRYGRSRYGRAYTVSNLLQQKNEELCATRRTFSHVVGMYFIL